MQSKSTRVALWPGVHARRRSRLRRNLLSYGAPGEHSHDYGDGIFRKQAHGADRHYNDTHADFEEEVYLGIWEGMFGENMEGKVLRL